MRIFQICKKYMHKVLNKSYILVSKFYMKTHYDKRIIICADSAMRNTKRESLNRLCDISDWKRGSDGNLIPIMKSLDEDVHIHRKAWEFALCIYGLEKLGVVHPDSIALAVGAGHERPLFYFANKIKEMVATDLYNDEGFKVEGNSEMLTNPGKFAPFSFRNECLTVKQMDGTDLEFNDETFDFTFSLSSIEHFGSNENRRKAIKEIYRTLKPGGIAAISTELILNKEKNREYFSIDEIEDVFLNTTNFKLVGGDIDYRISMALLLNPIDIIKEKNIDVSPHIILKTGNVTFTSIMLFLQK